MADDPEIDVCGDKSRMGHVSCDLEKGHELPHIHFGSNLTHAWGIPLAKLARDKLNR